MKARAAEMCAYIVMIIGNRQSEQLECVAVFSVSQTLFRFDQAVFYRRCEWRRLIGGSSGQPRRRCATMAIQSFTES